MLLLEEVLTEVEIEIEEAGGAAAERAAASMEVVPGWGTLVA